jgi:hypothetical protein
MEQIATSVSGLHKHFVAMKKTDLMAKVSECINNRQAGVDLTGDKDDDHDDDDDDEEDEEEEDEEEVKKQVKAAGKKRKETEKLDELAREAAAHEPTAKSQKKRKAK